MSDIDENEEIDIIQDQIQEPTEKKINKLNIKLIRENCFDWKLHKNKNEEQRIEFIINQDSLQLQWLDIQTIENLELFDKLEQLHLQNNMIEVIENMESLKELQYLALNNNQIKVLNNLQFNKNLIFLNVANNQIELVNYQQIPDSIELLDVRNNKISNLCEGEETKKQFFKCCQKIELYDNEEISTRDKMETLGLLTEEMKMCEQQMGLDFNAFDKDEDEDDENDEDEDEESEDEDEYEDDFIYRTTFKKQFITDYKKNENVMEEDAIDQLSKKTQQILNYMKKSGQVAQEQYAKRIQEYREMQLKIVEKIYQASNQRKIDKVTKSIQ